MEPEKKNDNIAEAFEDDGDVDDEDSVETAKDLVKIDEKENEKKAFSGILEMKKMGKLKTLMRKCQMLQRIQISYIS